MAGLLSMDSLVCGGEKRGRRHKGGCRHSAVRRVDLCCGVLDLLGDNWKCKMHKVGKVLLRPRLLLGLAELNEGGRHGADLSRALLENRGLHARLCCRGAALERGAWGLCLVEDLRGEHRPKADARALLGAWRGCVLTSSRERERRACLWEKSIIKLCVAVSMQAVKYGKGMVGEKDFTR